MEINLTTPALLFPAISLLMLAYTNRFLGLAGVIRSLHANYETSSNPKYLAQIENLRRRIKLTRDMQACGVVSLLLCTVCMFLIFEGLAVAGQILFGGSLVAMISSLVLSLWEIQMSVGALDHHLLDLEKETLEKVKAK
jgi:hypothetical protein